jgi:hypothetical protein
MTVTRTRKLALVAAALAALGLSATSASAETFWQARHPRRAEVNERLAYQNFRINREVREGELSPWQARRLHREDFAIRHEERGDGELQPRPHHRRRAARAEPPGERG